MNTWAVLAAKQAIIASGLGAGVVPAAGSGSVDGFAIGAVISGTCMFMLASARGRRPAAARAGGRLGLVTRGRNALSGLALEDASPEMIVPAPEGEQAGGTEPERRDAAGRDYQSRHRRSEHGTPDKQPEARSKPRHAAPTVSLSSRMTRLLAVRELASGVRG